MTEIHNHPYCTARINALEEERDRYKAALHKIADNDAVPMTASRLIAVEALYNPVHRSEIQKTTEWTKSGWCDQGIHDKCPVSFEEIRCKCDCHKQV